MLRADCGRHMYHRRALCRRKASLPRPAAVVRRVRLLLQRQSGCHTWQASSHAPALTESGKEAQHASSPCARAAPRWAMVSLSSTKGHCNGVRALSIGARSWCGVLATTSSAKPAAAWLARTHLRSLTLGRRRSMRARFARAPRCAGRGRFKLHIRAFQRRGGSLLWPAAMVRRTSYSLGCVSGVGAPALTNSGEDAQHASSPCARAAPRWAVIGLSSIEGHGNGESALSFGPRLWCDVPAAASNTKPVAACLG